MRVVNLGAQVDVGTLVARTRAERADSVLVSQVVSQREAHLGGAREVSAALRAAYAGERAPLLVVGGPGFDPAAAASLGVDKIFGRGTTPREVASYLVHALAPVPAREAAPGGPAREAAPVGDAWTPAGSMGPGGGGAMA
jgi:beta-lysine 5,6-aminomutase beta subunit